MKRALTTFAFGQQADLLDVSLPTFAKYAARQGYDLYVPEIGNFSWTTRPYSWWKVPLILSLFRSGYEEVLWLDADVVVVNGDRDIFDDVCDAPMGMVIHNTPDGAVPNCGVWPVRAVAASFLESIWPLDGFVRSVCWWEQAAVIAGLGGNPDATPVFVPGGPVWTPLPYEWNPHIRDARGVVNCRFFHATCFPDRKAAMQEMLR